MAYVSKMDNMLLMILSDDSPYSNPRINCDNLGEMTCWHNRYNLGDEHTFKEPNDFLMDLVLETVSTDDIIQYVKSGSAENLRLHYDRSAGGWEVEVYYQPSDKWCSQDFFEGNFKDNKSYIAKSIVDEMTDSDLMELAKTKNEILPLYLYDHSGISISTNTFFGRAVHAEWDSGQVGWIHISHKEIEKAYQVFNDQSVKRANMTLVGETKDYNSYLTGEVYGFRYFENGEEVESCWGFLGDIDNIKDEIAEHLPKGLEPLLKNLKYVYESEAYSYEEEYGEEYREMELVQ